jgi:hypothetical protein
VFLPACEAIRWRTKIAAPATGDDLITALGLAVRVEPPRAVEPTSGAPRELGSLAGTKWEHDPGVPRDMRAASDAAPPLVSPESVAARS